MYTVVLGIKGIMFKTHGNYARDTCPLKDDSIVKGFSSILGYYFNEMVHSYSPITISLSSHAQLMLNSQHATSVVCSMNDYSFFFFLMHWVIYNIAY